MMFATMSQPISGSNTSAQLLSMLQSARALLVQSPPGAGKTALVTRIATYEYEQNAGRVMIVVQTNEQVIDLACRLAIVSPHQRLYVLLRSRALPPAELVRYSNIFIMTDPLQLPATSCVVIANAIRWSWVELSSTPPFTLQIVDEAYQLAEYRFQMIAPLAHQHLLVGDPGQIHPVIRGSIQRWQDNQAGPHVPCPQALLTRDPSLSVLTISQSRRLIPDTVSFIQPTFYPTLPFTSAVFPHDRRMCCCLQEAGNAYDEAINRAESGESLLLCELPPQLTGELDLALIHTVALFMRKLLSRDPLIIDEDGATYPLEPSMIGIICTHRSQVGALRAALCAPPSLLIETADCFQGLERHITIVLHPLSGRRDIDAFHMDAGRFCVMLSRHRTACFLFQRAGTETLLERNPPRGDRVLGLAEDGTAQAWNKHRFLMRQLYQRQRLIPFANEA